MFDPTEAQIDKMKHAVGLDYHKPRYGKYAPHRNHYDTGGTDAAEWEVLKQNGFAIGNSDTMYHVSPKGMEYLEMIIDAKIIDYENVLRWGAICGNCRFIVSYEQGKKGLCSNLQSEYWRCKPKPTNKCKEHKYKDGLAYGGFIEKENRADYLLGPSDNIN